MTTSINWDFYLHGTPYHQVLEGVPHVGTPTMFSPCKKFIYLTTYDLAFKVNDVNSLQTVLQDVEKTLIALIKEFKDTPSWDLITKLHLYKTDYEVLCRLVSEQSNGTIENFPEKIFNQI